MKEIKAIWTVEAGVIPGEIIDRYSKTWEYTAFDWSSDQDKGPEELTRFAEIVQETTSYVAGLTNPAYVNWVQTQFLWIKGL